MLIPILKGMAERSSFYNAFNSEFEKHLPLAKNYKEAFDSASSTFERNCGQSPYKNYNSFKVARAKRRK